MPERGGAAAEVCFLSATLHFTARRPSSPSRPCPLCELPLPSWSLRTCAVGLRVAPTLRLQSARSLPGRLMACPAFTEKIHSQPETVTSFGQWVNRKISCSSLTTRNCYLLWPVGQPENQLLFTHNPKLLPPLASVSTGESAALHSGHFASGTFSAFTCVFFFFSLCC